MEATIRGTLHGTEDTVAGSGAHKTNIEVSLEGTLVLDVVAYGEVGAIDLCVALVHVSQVLGCEQSTGAQETSGVRRGVVGETSLESVLLELLGVSRRDDLISDKGGVDDLGNNTAVGAADAETVLP